MRSNMLKFSMFIEQSYSHIPHKGWTSQRVVIQCDVILDDIILRVSCSNKVKNLKENFGDYTESDWDENNQCNRMW